MALRDLKAVIYTDNKGRNWATKIDAAVFSQAGASTDPKVGGADYTGSPALPGMPRWLRPRTAKVSAAGNKRRVVCLSPDSELFDATETTIDLQVLGAAAVTYTRYGASDEKGGIEHDPTG